MKEERATKSMKVLELKNNEYRWVDRVVVLEPQLNIYLNEIKMASIHCTPKDEELLAVGYLRSKGYISSRREIMGVETVKEEYAVRVIVNNGYSGSPPPKRLFSSDRNDFMHDHTEDQTISYEKGKTCRYTKLGISGDDIIGILYRFKGMSQVYKKTRAVHGAALSSGRDILFFYEDIGRHNVIDKVMGRCLMDDLPTGDKILVMSGRITAEIIQKVRRTDIPVILSKAIATEEAIRNAEKMGISLIGWLQDNSVVIYSNPFQ
jgi:FdhD protein